MQKKARAPRADDCLSRVLEGAAPLVFDGAMGTQLQAAGLKAGAAPELICLREPEKITAIHAAYVAAGADVVTTNTFGANRMKLEEGARAEGLVRTPSVAEVFSAAIRCAREAHPRYVAADIGPTGALLKPLGTLSFDDAYELFAEQVRAATSAGADLIIIETMADLLEAKCALLAAKDLSDLPVFVTMTFGEDGRTFLGTTPEVAAITLSSLGADVVGINCSLGPQEVAPLVERMCAWSRVPVMVQANAGLPRVKGQTTVYDIGPDEYIQAVARMMEAGVNVVGGCCGTSPAYTAQERELVETRGFVRHQAKAPDRFVVASARRHIALEVGQVGVIGERINPTGKKKLKEALRNADYDYIMAEAIAQERSGAEILDVNAGLPEIDEAATLVKLVEELSGITSLPLQIDSTDPAAIEAAVRIYSGKPIINSCNGKRESLETILPIAKRYGCAIVGLTLDDQGIPVTAEGRLAVARRIVQACDAIGIPRQDILIDCLTMAISTDQTAAETILESMRLVKREFPGVRCVLGVSNVSFGLPYRELLGSVFLAAAFAAGLDLAIINPLLPRFADTVDSWRVLIGQDTGASHYIEKNAGRKDVVGAGPANAKSETAATSESDGGISRGVIDGRRDGVASEVRRLIGQGVDPISLIDSHLIPALDEVGKRFEAGTFFLPQLMASAEAAKAGFDEIRQATAGVGGAAKGIIALATVKGDIHDIGKNIVRMLLENYGYEVHDLGRDVEPATVVGEVVRHDIKLVGLSALMTTTVPAMAETIELLRREAPACKVMVGGAVLNPEYAEMVGADYYAKDASEAARIASEVFR